jgi:hypothetical protein
MNEQESNRNTEQKILVEMEHYFRKATCDSISHVVEKNGRRSRVQRFGGSRFYSRPRTAFGMRINEKSVSFARPNPKFGAELAIIWENKHF